MLLHNNKGDVLAYFVDDCQGFQDSWETISKDFIRGFKGSDSGVVQMSYFRSHISGSIGGSEDSGVKAVLGLGGGEEESGQKAEDENLFHDDILNCNFIYYKLPSLSG